MKVFFAPPCENKKEAKQHNANTLAALMAHLGLTKNKARIVGEVMALMQNVDDEDKQLASMLSVWKSFSFALSLGYLKRQTTTKKGKKSVTFSVNENDVDFPAEFFFYDVKDEQTYPLKKAEVFENSVEKIIQVFDSKRPEKPFDEAVVEALASTIGPEIVTLEAPPTLPSDTEVSDAMLANLPQAAEDTRNKEDKIVSDLATVLEGAYSEEKAALAAMLFGANPEITNEELRREFIKAGLSQDHYKDYATSIRVMLGLKNPTKEALPPRSEHAQKMMDYTIMLKQGLLIHQALWMVERLSRAQKTDFSYFQAEASDLKGKLNDSGLIKLDAAQAEAVTVPIVSQVDPQLNM